MKKLILLFLMLVGFVSVSFGQILTFEFSALTGSEVSANSNFNNSGLTASSISRGAGLTASANGGRFNATSWALTSIANAVSGNNYMEFTITPNSGFQFSVSSIVVQWQRSATGNTAISLRSSVDSYASDLDAIKSVTDATSTQTFTWSFTQSNSTSAVTYRLYSYAESTSGTGGPGDGSGNDIVVYGLVESTGGVDNPTGFSASAGSSSDIDLSWTQNGNSDDVMVAFNTENTFGDPSGSYAVDDPITGGGTVLFNGAGVGYNHASLTANTTYYYKAWSVDGTVTYSSGLTTNATTDGLSAPTASTADNIATTSFTANWEAVSGAESYRLDVSEYADFQTSTTTTSDLLISEYGEGSSNNKWIEIFNGTGSTVDLSYYTLKQSYNGGGWDIDITYTLPLSGSLANNDVYIICNDGAIQGIKDNADLFIAYNATVQGGRLVSFTGNDAIGLFKDGSLIDLFGDPASSSTISVAGSAYGDNHTMIRKSNISGGNTNWVSSAGIDASSSEWIVNSLDDYTDLGSHTMSGAGTPSFVTGYNDLEVAGANKSVTGLTAGTDYFYRVRAYSTTSTSGNSATISVTSASYSQNPVVSQGSDQDVVVGNSTGIGNIFFTTVGTGGNISVNRFDNAPSNHALSGNVSLYRWVIEPDGIMVYTQADGYTLRFEVANCPGISELVDGDNTTLSLYKRSTPGSGAFTGPIALTYYRVGADGDQSEDYIESELITSGFSEFVFQSGTEPLPVELTSFTAKATKAGVMLNWTTATEVNNFGFDVEALRATSKNWKKVGFVEGHGNSNSPKEYTFFDNSGASSYRLKQVDFNGNYEYSDVVTVKANLAKTELYQNSPNPFNPSTKISFSLAETGKVNVSVYNVIGQKVADLVNQTMESGVHNVDFNASNLPSGLYIYRMDTPNYSKTMKMLLIK